MEVVSILNQSENSANRQKWAYQVAPHFDMCFLFRPEWTQILASKITLTRAINPACFVRTRTAQNTIFMTILFHDKTNCVSYHYIRDLFFFFLFIY